MKVTRLESQVPEIRERKRVAAYARVSIDTERLQHSLSAQVSYYSNLIQNNPEWEYAGVFADYAVTGTKMDGRDEYQRLLDECEAGRIDIVLVKSISRFARNTVDLLNTVRHLKDIGIEVRFEKEKISTFSDNGELMLTLLASFAQEESRSISENSKWGLRKRFENGTIGLKYRRLYGYEHDGEQWRIVEGEAEIIRLIFKLHLEGLSLAEIVRKVNEAGARTVQGKEFGYQQVEKIITNEFYCGDRRLQKTFIEDPITKKKVRNVGQLPQYYIKDDHPALVDREMFGKAQEILAEHKAYRKKHLIPKYPFSSKITCGICGMHYNRHKGKSMVTGLDYPFWYCGKNKQTGSSCENKSWKEKILEEVSAKAMGTDGFDAEKFSEDVKEIQFFPDGRAVFHFYGGKKKECMMPPKPPKKPKPEMKPARPKQLFDGYIFCGKCGKRYGRNKITTSRGVYNMWRCRSKTTGNTNCGNVNYPEDDIKGAFCRVMKIDEFDDDLFKEKVEKVVIQDGGNIDFHLKSGRVKTVENLKFLPGRHEFTVTDAFTGKIRCRCGCEYTLATERDRYAYWRCTGKGRDYMECTAQDYPDYQLRKVSAYLMGTEGFDEELFREQVERITAVEDGLVYTFRDGRRKTWHRML